MKRGFTMVELMMAVMILSVMMVITFFTFNTVVRNWQKSMELVDKIQYADYALTQVVSGLRSAYYPTDGKQSEDFGFQLYDEGDKEDAADTIVWTKLGTAIVGNSSTLSETPHRVKLYVEKETRDSPGGLMVQATPDLLTDDQKEDMKDEKIFEPYLLVQGVRGFNCRVADKDNPFNEDGSWNWQDEWNESNSLPRAVELTFYLEPVEERGEPESVLRIVEIPLWDISQNPISATSEDKKNQEEAGAARRRREGVAPGGSGTRGPNGPGGTGGPNGPGGIRGPNGPSGIRGPNGPGGRSGNGGRMPGGGGIQGGGGIPGGGRPGGGLGGRPGGMPGGGPR